MKKMAVVLVLVVISVAVHAQRGSSIRIPRVHESMLVSTDWLAKHLDDPKVVILHVSRDGSDYAAGHIPGARFVSLGQLAVARNGLGNELPPVEQLQKLFESVGVGDGERVVLYGERANLFAARAWFTLDYLGHGGNAALLDGGLEKWRAEKRPITTDTPNTRPAKFTPRVNPEVLADFADVRKLSNGDTGAILLDARPIEDYTGARTANDTPRPGHIPGAASLFWMDTLESKQDPQLKPPYELRRLFEAAGAVPGSTVVTYCHSGVQASHLYFTAKYLGYDVRMYDGSFQEWSSHSEVPVITGKK